MFIIVLLDFLPLFMYIYIYMYNAYINYCINLD